MNAIRHALVLLGLFLLSAVASAQATLGGSASTPGGSQGRVAVPVPGPQAAGPGPLVVRVMPGYPNAPHYQPEERKLVEDGEETVVWGNAEKPGQSLVGASYTWSFVAGPNVEIRESGSSIGGNEVAGTISNPAFIYELLEFHLLNGSTAEVVTAMLSVDLGGGEIAQRVVEMLVLSDQDPLIDEPLEELQFNVNLAVDGALRYLYLAQDPTGYWAGGGQADSDAATGFSLWAFQNVGHVPSNDPGEDIYVNSVKRGLSYAFTRARVFTASSNVRADEDFGATVDGKSDQNNNTRQVRLTPSSRRGYTHPILCSAIIASTLPNELVTLLDGSNSNITYEYTYREVVQDAIDYMGATMSLGGNNPDGTSGESFAGRGGWTYAPSQSANRSDMSINSWAFVACEGAESIFDVEVPYWFKRELEYQLYWHQRNPTGSSGFSYEWNSGSTRATTGGGLSGLRLIETTSFPQNPPGTILEFLESGPHSIADKRAAAVSYLGANWNATSSGATYGSSNRGNPYVMWTVARALRLTAEGLGFETITLLHGGEEFDWQTGYEVNTGILPGPGAAREGYFPYLVRTQTTTGSVSARGRWTSGYGTNAGTAMYVLVLNPGVFSLPCQVTQNQVFEELSPADNTTLPANTTVVLSGRVTPGGAGLDISAVYVDGQVVDSLDAAGNFFKVVTVAPGENVFEVLVVQPCGDVETAITLIGEVPGQVDFEQYETVTFFTDVEYSNTTWIPSESILQVDVTACNTGGTALLGPLLMVFDTFTNAGVSLTNPDGYNADGEPYVIFGSSLQDANFAPGDCSVPRQLRFSTPTFQAIDFELQWLAPTNRPPVFTTVPPTIGAPGGMYVYDSEAVDVDGHDVVYSPLYGPEGVTVDPVTGEVLWNAASIGTGTFGFGIRAEDGFGGSSVQEFVLTLVDTMDNRPPYFSSSPPTHVAVGGSLHYQASGVDPDQDPLEYSLLVGPTGMAMTLQGLLTWEFAPQGLHPVRIRVIDGNGGSAEQAWVIAVGSTNSNEHAPVLYGTPSVVAVVGDPYTYQPFAFDLDNDNLLFRLLQAPPGMTVDAQTGFVRWTPSSSAVGTHEIVLEVDDQSGDEPNGIPSNTASQQWSIEVFADAVNRPPIIQTIPNLVGVVGEPYVYDVDAVDPDDHPVTYDLSIAPSGMTIDELTGVVQWTPGAEGDFPVGVLATDPEDASGAQVYTLRVIPPNASPVITSTPTASVTVGALWSYLVDAEDAENHPLTYSLVEAPNGMTMHSQLGYALWRPELDDVGDHDVTVRVDDDFGGFAEQSFVLTAVPDTESPSVLIAATPNPAVVGEPVEICVFAGDNVGVETRSLTIDGQPQALDVVGCVTIVPDMVGQLALHGEATDASQNVGMQDLLLDVVEEPVPQFGEVLVHAPQPGAVIDRPTPIVGTISDGQLVGPTPSVDWRVQIRPEPEGGAWRVVDEGTGTVDNDELAVFDPTILRNGGWLVQVLTSVDGGPWTGLQFPVDVVGTYKLGEFTTALVDLTIPLAGIPIVITREYSSLDTTSGDFGPGWRLGLPGRVADAPVEGSNEGLYIGGRVFVTRADGYRTAFRVEFVPDSWIFPFIGRVRLRPEVGLSEKLTIPGDPAVFFSNGYLYEGLFSGGFNPDLYQFETQERVTYLVDEIQGLQSIEDAFGNSIEVTPAGLFSSTGLAILFQRDLAGRIVEIVEPDDPTTPDGPASLRYEYDEATGNLIASFTQDTSVSPTLYFYEHADQPHHLTRIEDPSGAAVVQNVFDASGRLVAQCNASGALPQLPADPCGTGFEPPEGCSLFCLDSEIGSVQTIINARGYRAELILDDRGNVLIERRYEAGNAGFRERAFTYWVKPDGTQTDWLATETDWGDGAAGQVAIWLEYDDRGHVTRRELRALTYDATSRVWSFDYNECDRLEREVDPLGNQRLYEYDENCRVRFITDALGGVTEYQYDSFGRRTHFIDALGNTWEYVYDSVGRLQEIVDPFGSSTQLTTSLTGELLRVVNRNGWIIDYTYDAEHRRTSETWRANLAQGGTLAQDRTTLFEYDDRGFLSAAIAPDSIVRREYWPTGLMKREVSERPASGLEVSLTYGVDDGNGLESGYDANGNRTHVTQEWGAGGATPQIHTQYEYDAFDRLQTIQQTAPAGSVSAKSVELIYNEQGQISQLGLYNGVSFVTPLVRSQYEYDCGGCSSTLSRIHHLRESDQQSIRDTSYLHDAAGNVRSISDENGQHEYQYDGLGRLIAADHPTGSPAPDEWYSYDAAGNRLASHSVAQLEYSYDGPDAVGNRLVLDDAYEYEYDLVGSVTAIQDRTSNARQEFSYNHQGRVVRFIERDTQGAIVADVEYGYDPLGRRAWMTSGDTRLEYFYDRDNPTLTLEPGYGLVESALYTNALDALVATEVDGQTRWALVDHLGSVQAMLDAQGAEVVGYSYDSFGQVVASTGSAPDNRFRYTSREFDPNSDFGYYRLRTYDPRTGRFLQEDSLRSYSYDYVGGNPLSFYDPYGLAALVGEAELDANAAKQICSLNRLGGSLAIGLAVTFYVATVPLALTGQMPAETIQLLDNLDDIFEDLLKNPGPCTPKVPRGLPPLPPYKRPFPHLPKRWLNKPFHIYR